MYTIDLVSCFDDAPECGRLLMLNITVFVVFLMNTFMNLMREGLGLNVFRIQNFMSNRSFYKQNSFENEDYQPPPPEV